MPGTILRAGDTAGKNIDKTPALNSGGKNLHSHLKWMDTCTDKWIDRWTDRWTDVSGGKP